jgi:GT2 family glycosyltransferase
VPCLLSYYFHGRADNQITALEPAQEADALVRSSQRHKCFSLPLEPPTITSVQGPPQYEFYGASPFKLPSVRAPFVSIIVVSYEAAEYLEYCLQSVFRFTPNERFELIVVDNASKDSAPSVIQHFSKRSNVRAVYNTSNTGFTFAVNQGIQLAAPRSDIILLNNDAVVTPGWLDALQEPLGLVPDVGLVVPRQTLLPKTPTLETHAPFARPKHEADVNISAHHDGVLDVDSWAPLGFIELSFAPFFCVYITRECLNEAGPLDAENGRHYRSDRLYCDIIRNHARRRIIYTPKAKVYHFLQQSTKALKQINESAYKTMFVDNKWGAGEFERLSQNWTGQASASSAPTKP